MFAISSAYVLFILIQFSAFIIFHETFVITLKNMPYILAQMLQKIKTIFLAIRREPDEKW